MKFVRLFSLAALAAALVLISAESRAAMITLPSPANSLAGNFFVIGDKHFSFQQVIPGGSTPPSLAGITVHPLSPVGTTQAAAVQPFGFQLAGSVVSAGPGATSDLLLNFLVETTGGQLITSVSLFANGAAGNGGSLSIGETFIDANTGLADGTLSLIGAGSGSPDPFVLPVPTTRLFVSKDINANGGTNGTASYSDVRNVFNQQVIPEPTSVVMLGCGLVGVFGLSLSRSRKLSRKV